MGGSGAQVRLIGLILAILVSLLLCIVAKGQDQAGECLNCHATLHSAGTFCNGTLMINSLDNQTYSQFWSDCQNVASNPARNETMLASFWRVYTCVLSKFLPKGQKTISLEEFANIQSENYPEDIRTSILSSVEGLQSSKTSNTTWFKSSVLLSEAQNLDKIRALYFDVEKQVCHDRSTDTPSISGGFKQKTWTKCSIQEEVLHRDADCCGNFTIPFKFRERTRATWSVAPSPSCNKTLDKLIQKFSDPEVAEKVVLRSCHLSCSLIEAALITLDNFLNMKSLDELPIELLVNKTYPYMPSTALTKLGELVRSGLNRTDLTPVVKQAVDRMNVSLGLIVEPEDVYGCLAVQTVARAITTINLRCQFL